MADYSDRDLIAANVATWPGAGGRGRSERERNRARLNPAIDELLEADAEGRLDAAGREHLDALIAALIAAAEPPEPLSRGAARRIAVAILAGQRPIRLLPVRTKDGKIHRPPPGRHSAVEIVLRWAGLAPTRLGVAARPAVARSRPRERRAGRSTRSARAGPARPRRSDDEADPADLARSVRSAR